MNAIIGPIVRPLRFVLLAVCLLALGACQLEVEVDLRLNADGTGEVVVAAAVDADVVDQLPGLEGSLRLDDAAAAGWIVDGPAPTESGGLAVTLRHPVATPAEAATLVNNLGPPFEGVTVEQVATDDDVTTSLTGSMVLANGFDTFADDNLLAATGATPFRAQLDAVGATPPDNMSVELTFHVPGRIDSNGDATEGGVRWTAPLDGSSRDLSATAVLGDTSGSSWAGPVATAALVLLGLWLIGGGYLAYRVWTTQRRRRSRRSTIRYR